MNYRDLIKRANDTYEDILTKEELRHIQIVKEYKEIGCYIPPKEVSRMLGGCGLTIMKLDGKIVNMTKDEDKNDTKCKLVMYGLLELSGIYEVLN